MSLEAINTILYRPIKKGTSYDRFMPSSDCKSTALAKGNTEVAINQMAHWSKKYQHHTKDLTKEKFSNYNAANLCKALHHFLYHHLQYKIDAYDQLLRSPACTWQSRFTGIDCKSYSIFASTILLNRGVSHYLRRVRLSDSEGYSHVYVVVPKDQKGFDLQKGYYTIDGTLKSDQEPTFYSADDVFVSTQKQGLAGLGVAQAVSSGVGQLVSYAVGEFIAEMNSCSGSLYDTSVVALKIRRELRDELQRQLRELEDAIFFRNRARIMHLFNTIFKELDLGIAHLRNETAFSANIHCDGQTLAMALSFAEKLKTFIDNFFEEFKAKNPHFNVEEFTKQDSVKNRTLYFVVNNDTNPIVADYRFIVLRKEVSKYGLDPIFPFEANRNTWLLSHTTYLARTYQDKREIAYEKEMTPVLDKITQLRKRVHLGGEMLYYFEQPLQREGYRIWLKYDQKYTEFLTQEAQNKQTANALALADYKRRFSKQVTEDQNAKKRKSLKKQLGVGALVGAVLYLYFKKK